MLQIELVPDLNNCVETVAKKEYNEVVRQLLTAEEGNEKLHERQNSYAPSSRPQTSGSFDGSLRGTS